MSNSMCYWLSACALGTLIFAPGATAARPVPVMPASACPAQLLDDVTAWVVPGSTSSASSCYGLFDGNTPKGSLTIGGNSFGFLGKHDIGAAPTATEGFDGFVADFATGSFTFSGGPMTFDGVWVVTVKQSRCFGAWTFDAGTYSGGSFQGNWVAAGGGGGNGCRIDDADRTQISHLSIYGPTPSTQIPEPRTLALIGLGLLGVALLRRRKPKD